MEHRLILVSLGHLIQTHSSGIKRSDEYNQGPTGYPQTVELWAVTKVLQDDLKAKGRAGSWSALHRCLRQGRVPSGAVWASCRRHLGRRLNARVREAAGLVSTAQTGGCACDLRGLVLTITPVPRPCSYPALLWESRS